MAHINYLLFVILFASATLGMHHNSANSLRLSAKPELANLLDYFSIPTRNASIIEQATQRWCNNNALCYDYTISKPLLEPYFEKLGLTKELQPKYVQYQYILLVGDFYQNTQKILRHLETVIQSNIQCERIVLLCSDRTLEPFEKTEVFTEQHIKTETDMLRYLYCLSMQTHAPLIKIPNHLIIASCISNATNPIIAQKIAYWVKTNPLPGKCLLISEQPYAHLKKKIIELYMPNAFEVDIAAAQAESTVPASIFLHAAACHIQFDIKHPYNSSSFFQMSL
jgi:hypothetical protein